MDHCKLLNPNPKGRLTAKGFLEIGTTDTGFFTNNPLVKVCTGLDNFTLASEGEKSLLLRMLNESLTLEFGGASAANIVSLVIKIGKDVPQDEYQSAVLGPLVKLFASPDRGIRMALLDNLPEYADKLDKKTVDGRIFPHLQTGFSDTVAVIREATIKAVPLLSPKLSDRTLNNDLLRFLAKMQSDPEASIRTNTCILIGRLGPTLGYNTKRKVLVPAFLRALKDPFVHARVAGLMAFMATIDCFENEELATKVIPNMSFALVDKEKDQAFKAIELFVKRLESYAATLPETVINPLDRVGEQTMTTAQGTLVNSAAGAAGALAGWAMSSLGKRTKLNGGLTSKAKGLQLGASKVSSGVAVASLAQQLADEAAAEDGLDSNPWGNDDLMDVNADEDDWINHSATLSPPVSSDDWESNNGWDTAPSSGVNGLATMTKEEKAAEMARRKEERKQASRREHLIKDVLLTT
ncbi:hypothetical protein MPER_11155, partial [Moniliophthora perniciosa FA553]